MQTATARAADVLPTLNRSPELLAALKAYAYKKSHETRAVLAALTPAGVVAEELAHVFTLAFSRVTATTRVRFAVAPDAEVLVSGGEWGSRVVLVVDGDISDAQLIEARRTRIAHVRSCGA